MNPSNTWTYRDESYGHVLALLGSEVANFPCMLFHVKFSDDSWQLTEFLESARDFWEEKTRAVDRPHAYFCYIFGRHIQYLTVLN